MFDDLLEANRRYQEGFQDTGLSGVAARELAVLTCIDSRIDPLAMLGLKPGEAKIIRNAGARVTDDALRSLILATNLLNAKRICVVQHTDCAMTGRTEAETRAKISEARGVDAIGWEFLSTTDQMSVFRKDLQRLRECELLPPDLEVGAFIFDVRTGALNPVDPDAAG
jgi:carbonic anhydrase